DGPPLLLADVGELHPLHDLVHLEERLVAVGDLGPPTAEVLQQLAVLLEQPQREVSLVPAVLSRHGRARPAGGIFRKSDGGLLTDNPPIAYCIASRQCPYFGNILAEVLPLFPPWRCV